MISESLSILRTAFDFARKHEEKIYMGAGGAVLALGYGQIMVMPGVAGLAALPVAALGVYTGAMLSLAKP